jgi:tRNA/tmRNA/rRNA uracil-C5-methylase (TrmA/RlmC/RlmD family)
MRVLDLGAGSGNTALLAAGRGAEVTAVDLTDDLFGTCRQRAAAAGVTVTWAAVNPEDLIQSPRRPLCYEAALIGTALRRQEPNGPRSVSAGNVRRTSIRHSA